MKAIVDSYTGGYSTQGYPLDWPEISLAVRNKAGDRCQECGVAGGDPHPKTGRKAIIQVAHLDHDKSNCDEQNLKVLCHRCHSRRDRHHKRESARKRRERPPEISAIIDETAIDASCLETYLRLVGLSACAFAYKTGLERSGVYRHLKHRPVDYETAIRISTATNGVVDTMQIYRTGRNRK